MNHLEIVHVDRTNCILPPRQSRGPDEYIVHFDGEAQEWMRHIEVYEVTFGESTTSDGISEVRFTGAFGELRLDTRYVTVTMRTEAEAWTL
jgi:hypothetical protein